VYSAILSVKFHRVQSPLHIAYTYNGSVRPMLKLKLKLGPMSLILHHPAVLYAGVVNVYVFQYRYSGLHCVAVSGWAKGAEYRPGDRITSAAPNHSWNALCIDGSWHLVDCHWATRYLKADGDSTSSDSDSKFGFEYDEFYFLTEPDEMIFSHLPVDEKWQLMENTWSPGMVRHYLHNRVCNYSTKHSADINTTFIFVVCLTVDASLAAQIV